MKKNIIIIASLIIIIAAAMATQRTFTFKASSVRAEGLVTTTTASPLGDDAEASLIAAKFIKQIAILNKVKIDDGIFSDPSFQSLEDWSRPIPDEAAGRANPFAPF